MDVKLNLHNLTPAYGHNASHGCLITANNINLISLDSEFDNRDLITYGTLNVSSNSEDIIKLITNGNVNVNENARLNIGSSEFKGDFVLNNGSIKSTGNFTMLEADVVNNGSFVIDKFITERLGHILGTGSFYTENYSIINKEFVNTESSSKVYNLNSGNVEIVMNHPFQFEDLKSNMTFSGSSAVEISGLCKSEIKYINGSVNLSNIQLQSSRYGKCNIDAQNINITSFDKNYQQNRLTSKGVLSVNDSYTGNYNFTLYHTGRAILNSSMDLRYHSNISGVLIINSNVHFRHGNYTHEGIIVNNGTLTLDQGRTLIINGDFTLGGTYNIGECKLIFNGEKLFSHLDKTVKCE